MRQPIPIRDPVREAAAARPSEVKTYKLSREEIERIFGGAKKPEGKAPMQLTPEWKHQPKEDDDMKLTKEQYLAERLAGKTRNAICREHNINPGTLYGKLEKWGIKDLKVETNVLEELRRGMQPEPVPEPTDEQIERLVSYHEGWKDAREHAELTGETISSGDNTYPRLELGPDTLKLAPEIEWFTPGSIRSDSPSVSVSQRGFCFDGVTAKRLGLVPGARVKIGVAGRQLIVERDASGLMLQRSGATGCKLASESLSKWPAWKRIVKKKYPVQLRDGMIVADVEVAGE